MKIYHKFLWVCLKNKLLILRVYCIISVLSILHYLVDRSQLVYLLCILSHILIWMDLFLIVSLNPLLHLDEHLGYLPLFWVAWERQPFSGEFILCCVDEGFTLILHVVQSEDSGVILLQLFLYLLHLDPFLLLYLVEVVNQETTDHALGTYNFVPVEYENDFVRGVYTQVSDGLRSDFVFVVQVNLNDALLSEIERVLTWILRALVKHDLLISIILRILTQINLIPHTSPDHTHSCKVFHRYIIRKFHKRSLNSTINRCTSRHSLTWIQCLRCLNPENVGNNALNQWDSGCTSDHLHCKVLWGYLHLGLHSAFDITQRWCHFAQHGHDYILKLLSFHIIRQIILIHNILNIQMMLTIRTQNFSLFLNHLF